MHPGKVLRHTQIRDIYSNSEPDLCHLLNKQYGWLVSSQCALPNAPLYVLSVENRRVMSSRPLHTPVLAFMNEAAVPERGLLPPPATAAVGVMGDVGTHRGNVQRATRSAGAVHSSSKAAVFPHTGERNREPLPLIQPEQLALSCKWLIKNV